jgi:hypothetical protein
MLTRLAVGFVLMAVCVTIHAVGVSVALHRLRRSPVPPPRFLPRTQVLLLLASWVVVLHLVEIAAWALLFTWNGAMPDLSSALYFSAVTYTTTGYGDLVLPKHFRLDGGIEALTGILMCGWSTGFFFTVVNRFYDPKT